MSRAFIAAALAVAFGILGYATSERATRTDLRIEDGGAGAPSVCLALADSPELILLVHRARGPYCMW